MKICNVDQSNALYARAQAVIPGGIFGHFGAAVRAAGPKFFSRSGGARFQDIDGNEYVDYMCGFGPMILGYNHPEVESAALDKQRLGQAVSVASPVMVELAEHLVERIDGADWALFGKNGTDATSLAVMIARAATGRRKIIKVDGAYHGVAPWMREGQLGAIAADGEQVLKVRWNDVAGFERLLTEHGDDVACFIATPYHHPVLADNEMPASGYWPSIEALCRARGIALIVDDVRTGFRIELAGSHKAFGFTPDMICFGKAIANGHPLAALVGSDALKQTASEVYYGGTQFFTGAPMAAALATLRELERGDAVTRMGATGARLSEGLVQAARANGHELIVSGVPAMPYYRLEDVPFRRHAQWVDECLRRGVYLLGFHNHFLSLAHTQADLEHTWEAADAAFKALGKPAQAA